MREDHFLFVDLTSVLVINTHADGYDVKMKGKSLSTGCFIQIWVFIELYFAKFDTKSFFMKWIIWFFSSALKRPSFIFFITNLTYFNLYTSSIINDSI